MDCTALNTVAEILEAFRTCSNAGEQIELFECLATRPAPPVDAFVQILDKIRLEPVKALAIQAFGQISDADIKERLKQSDDLLTMLSQQAESGASDLIRWAAATAIETVGFDFTDISQHLTRENKIMVTTEDLFNQGLEKYEEGNYKEAIEIFSFLIRPSLTFVNHYHYRAISYWKMGDYQSAIEDCTQVIHLTSEWQNPYNLRAICREELEDYLGAVEDYTQVIRLAPNQAESYRLRGRTRYKLGDERGAIEDYQKAANIYLDAGEMANYETVIGIIRKIL